MIQPIETHYADCRFRSRLEARWAVFFDHLGITWQYEPQGFKLPDDSCYLPDFLVHPGTPREFWFEVKGVHPASEELTKAQHLATGTGINTFVYFGQIELPGVGLAAKWHHRGLDAYLSALTEQWSWDNETGWFKYPSGPLSWEIGLTPTAYRISPATERFPARKPRSGHIWWTDCGDCGQVILKNHGQQGPCRESDGESYPNFRHETPRLVNAYRTARSARFEHGEQPARPDSDWPPVAKPGGEA